MNKLKYSVLALCVVAFSTCTQQRAGDSSSQASASSTSEIEVQKIPNRNVYWGDTHLHTNFSSDAFLFGTMTATPDDAYRFAKGEALIHPITKQKLQINDPLDFLIVADHAEGLGTMMKAKSGDEQVLATEFGKKLAELVNADNLFVQYMAWMKGKNVGKVRFTELDTGAIMQSIWNDYISYADQHYEPGKFTTFIGWEWTSTPNGKNMHRVVFTPDNKEKARQFLPYSSTHSPAPEDLWNWLDETSQALDIEFMAMPHNSNVSGGLMFPEEKSFKGNPVNRAYAEQRSRWESVAEISQIKGTSETTPDLSPTDEFAYYELWNIMLSAETGSVQRGNPGKGDFLRDSLRTGLKLEEKTGINPYKYGLIGSSDSHTASSGVEENNFTGKFYVDGLQPDKSKNVILSVKAMDFSSSGYAAVWAESNTREDIYSAFKRKEVYGTTGPRILLRLFAGFDFEDSDVESANYTTIGYEKGVPMGGDLTSAPADAAPTLMIVAAKDPNGANLDRVQVVKGWLENGVTKEKVFDVKWAGDRVPDENGKLPSVGNTVDTKTATYTNDIGANELAVVWTDPEFDSTQKAFYYVRVLEIPTPRYSTYASARLGQEAWAGTYSTIQERAYSSPIWYTPSR